MIVTWLHKNNNDSDSDLVTQKHNDSDSDLVTQKQNPETLPKMQIMD